jgi:ribonuclease BN (tRNA processing enzyme)
MEDKILLDIGPGTMHRLLEAQTTIFQISHIFLSHFHPDHSGELVPFLFATKYPNAELRTNSLSLFAGKGFSAFYQKLQDVYGDWVRLTPGMMNITELSTSVRDVYEATHFTLETVPMRHNPESIACRFTSLSGKSVVYSGDTDFNENLIELSMNADLLICESALPDDLKVTGHLTPSSAGKIASSAKVKKLILTHLYPECDKVDIENECRKTYTGPLILAHDLLTVEIN